MSLTHGNNFGMRLVDSGMQYETRTVNGMAAFHNVSLVVRQYEI